MEHIEYLPDGALAKAGSIMNVEVKSFDIFFVLL
jgi:hypothetical protein